MHAPDFLTDTLAFMLTASRWVWRYKEKAEQSGAKLDIPEHFVDDIMSLAIHLGRFSPATLATAPLELRQLLAPFEAKLHMPYAKFAGAGYTTLPGGSYRSQWWVLHNENGAYSARGIHGQAIYIDPTAEMVIARFATFPISFNAAIDPTSLPAYQAVADYLSAKSE